MNFAAREGGRGGGQGSPLRCERGLVVRKKNVKNDQYYLIHITNQFIIVELLLTLFRYWCTFYSLPGILLILLSYANILYFHTVSAEFLTLLTNSDIPNPETFKMRKGVGKG